MSQVALGENANSWACPCRCSRSKISPGVVTVILTGSQVWNPLLGSSATSWKFTTGQTFPSTLNFSISQVGRVILRFLYLLHYRQVGNVSSLLSPFPLEINRLPWAVLCPQIQLLGIQGFFLEGSVWKWSKTAHQFSFQAKVSRDVTPAITPGMEPTTRYSSQDPCTPSPSHLDRCWDAHFPVCPSTRFHLVPHPSKPFLTTVPTHCDLSLF